MTDTTNSSVINQTTFPSILTDAQKHKLRGILYEVMIDGQKGTSGEYRAQQASYHLERIEKVLSSL